MKSYIYTLLIVSLMGGIVNSLINSCGNVKKYINNFLSLLMVLCMVSPITDVLENVNDLKISVSNFFEEIVDNEALNEKNEIIINTGTEAIIKGIKNTLIDKFNIDEKEILVELETDKSNIESIKIKKINIILTGKASWSDVETVKKYLENVIGGDISVVRR